MCYRGPLHSVQPIDVIDVEEVWMEDPLYCDELANLSEWLLQTPEGDGVPLEAAPCGVPAAPAAQPPHAAPLPALWLPQSPACPSPFEGMMSKPSPALAPYHVPCAVDPFSALACTPATAPLPLPSGRGDSGDSVISWLSGWARLASSSETSTRCSSPCKPTGSSAAGAGSPFAASASLEAASSSPPRPSPRSGSSSGSPAGTSLQRTCDHPRTKHTCASKQQGKRRQQRGAPAAARDAPAWARNLVNAMHEAALAVRFERAAGTAPAETSLESLSHRRQMLEAELAKATHCLARMHK